MDIDKVLKERRNIRTYNNKIISENIIKELIEAAQWAPSACNRQGIRFIILNEVDIKRLTYAGTAWFLPDAKQGLLVLYDNRSDNTEYTDYLLSGAAAVQNLILKAWSLGIGVGWVNNMPPQNIVKKLSTHKNIDVILEKEVDRKKFDKLGTIVSYEFPKITLSVERAKSNFVAAKLLESFPVEDINIKEPDIEEIIREVFRGKELS